MKRPVDAFVEAVVAEPRGLFSIRDRSRLREHWADGAAGAEVFAQLGVRSFVDVGSGGGIPALPLLDATSELQGTLVESVAWKAAFLTRATEALDLESRVRVVCGRAEERVDEVGREAADAATARAVAAPAVLAEYLTPYVRVGGALVLWASAAQVPEFDAVGSRPRALLGLAAECDVVPVDSPLRDEARIVVWRKVAACDARFPRRTGIAARRPLR